MDKVSKNFIYICIINKLKNKIMKTIFFNVFALSLMLSLIFTSCKKDDDNTTPTNNNTSNSTLSFKMNGVIWKSNTTSGTYAFINDNYGYKLTSSNSNTSMDLYIYGKTQKTYFVGYENITSDCGSSYNDGQKTWASEKGKITLTKVDEVNKKLSGTFEFKLVSINLSTLVKDSINLTDGAFTDYTYTIGAK